MECPRDRSLGIFCFCCILQTCYIQLVTGHQLTPHAYADDLQIHSECRPIDVVCLQDSMSACVDDVACWMAANRLQLNHAKSEVLGCSPTRRQHQIPSRAVRIGSTAVRFVSAVRDLGIMLDAEVTMSTQVRLCCRQSKYRGTATDP